MMGQAQSNPPKEQAFREIIDALRGLVNTIDSETTLSQLLVLLSLIDALAKQTANAKVTLDGDDINIEGEDITVSLTNLPRKFYEPIIAYKIALINYKCVTHLMDNEGYVYTP